MFNKNNFPRIIRNVVVILMGIVLFIPMYVAIISAFKYTPDIINKPLSFMTPLTFDNIIGVFTNPNIDMLNMYKNSFKLITVSVLIVLFVTPMAGYYIARTNPKRGNILLMMFLAGMMIPPQIVLIPLVKMYANLKLLGSYAGMYIFYGGSYTSLAIMLYSKFIKTIPCELEEAAYIEGATPFQTFWKIIFPLLKPITATVAVFIGRNIWNDFLMPLYLLGGKDSQTVTTGIYKSIGPYASEWSTVFGTVFVASVPMVILFFIMQKHFVGGLADGAVKG